MPPLPRQLDTPEFREAWQDWLKYRAERRQGITPTTAKAQLAKLANAGPSSAVAMIHQSIENGWQGLFEVRKRREDMTEDEINNAFVEKYCESSLAAHGAEERRQEAKARMEAAGSANGTSRAETRPKREDPDEYIARLERGENCGT